MKRYVSVQIITPIDDFHINVFIDGSWGVDALIGYKTRDHNDVDLHCFEYVNDGSIFYEEDSFPSKIFSGREKNKGIDYCNWWLGIRRKYHAGSYKKMHGFDKKDFEFVDYDKAKNFTGRIRKDGKYRAVIFYACPHKTAGLA